MLRSSRFVASFATALAVGGATVLVPATPALAADTPIYRTILQPGEDESQVMVTWRTRSKADEVLEVTGPEGTKTFRADERDYGALLYKSSSPPLPTCSRIRSTPTALAPRKVVGPSQRPSTPPPMAMTGPSLPSQTHRSA